jgi:hypothetical protein
VTILASVGSGTSARWSSGDMDERGERLGSYVLSIHVCFECAFLGKTFVALGAYMFPVRGGESVTHSRIHTTTTPLT